MKQKNGSRCPFRPVSMAVSTRIDRIGIFSGYFSCIGSRFRRNQPKSVRIWPSQRELTQIKEKGGESQHVGCRYGDLGAALMLSRSIVEVDGGSYTSPNTFSLKQKKTKKQKNKKKTKKTKTKNKNKKPKKKNEKQKTKNKKQNKKNKTKKKQNKKTKTKNKTKQNKKRQTRRCQTCTGTRIK